MIRALLDLVYGERCARCHAARGSRPWCAAGPPVPGLRAWDAPHLCASCAAALAAAPVVALLAAGALPVVAARREDRALVDLVGRWKYRGLRGLGWPLGRLLLPAAAHAEAAFGAVDVLVPVPLHRARRAERGFNQAEVLARVVAAARAVPVRADVLRRRRATGQQAALATGAAARRAANVAGAFDATSPPPGRSPLAGRPRVGLVDDLVTTGATWAQAAAALADAGWDVRWGLALGAAARLCGPVALDTAGVEL